MTQDSDRTNFEIAETGTPVVVNAPQTSKKNSAGFWRRFAAVLLDSLVLLVVQFPINFIGDHLGASQSLSWTLYSSLLGVTLNFLYQGYFLTTKNATLGKMAMSIQVVRLDHLPIDFKTVVIRELIGKPISGIILCIGYLMAAFRDDKRALHDLMAGTQVVESK